MKKVISALAACSIFTVICTGCGDSSDIDKKLVGSWNSEEIGGNLNFSEDGKVSMSVNYDSLGIHFNDDMKFVMEDTEIDVDYDGKKAVVDAAKAFGLDEEMLFIEMERTGDENKDSLDGEYKLTGGMIYDELMDEFENGPATYMIVDGETLDIKLDICDYKADGKKITLTGEGLALLDMGDEETAECEYKIDGDTLSMTEEDEDGEKQTVELTKVK